MKNKTVKDYMIKNVLYFRKGDSIISAIKKLSKKGVTGAPVVDKDKKVIGIISASDLSKMLDIETVKIGPMYPSEIGLLYILFRTKKRMDSFLEKAKISSAERVEEIMIKDVVTISPEKSVYSAATLMNAHDINRVPVVENKKLKGIITRQDVIKALID